MAPGIQLFPKRMTKSEMTVSWGFISYMPHFPMALAASSPRRSAVLGPGLEALRKEWKGRVLPPSLPLWSPASLDLFPPSLPSTSCPALLPRGSDSCENPKGSVLYAQAVALNCHSSVFLTLCLGSFPRSSRPSHPLLERSVDEV